MTSASLEGPFHFARALDRCTNNPSLVGKGKEKISWEIGAMSVAYSATCTMAISYDRCNALRKGFKAFVAHTCNVVQDGEIVPAMMGSVEF